ncbi:ATP-dependent DNA helicase RecG [Crassaminicella thermophila]|uniref:ATP-dependent DNA helicase RecG n=1 Tax=Crassaminicella thermophila TaxID=2599308 RepID=A0A5C0SE53_CRATE|nr:ATP-dependent DNA helicase RecG [Crassaminicella thermophila]QEK12007.1 ATP-dependent DNA helicase RecG [Crassaminicella thermophila]
MNDLKQSIQYIKGVGPKRLKHLEKMGIYNIEDFIYSFPREYEDRSNIKKIIDVKDNEKVTLNVTVFGKVQEKLSKKGLKIYKLPVRDSTGIAYAIFYNAHFVKSIFKVGQMINLYGKTKRNFGEIQILHPNYEFVENDLTNTPSSIIPIYTLTNGLTQKDMRNLGKNILNLYGNLIQEYIPNDICKRNRLCDIQYALWNIHFPTSLKALKIAKFRLVFEELFILQLGLWLIKNKLNNNIDGITFHKKKEIDKFIKSLPFQLTKAQIRVLREIERDMESNKVMNRLVQGDVGSGKTIIAIIALYKTILNGYQGVLMAPTEILAEQHFESSKELLLPLGIKIELLSGSIPKKKKEDILKRLKDGDIDIVIGTHALIQENVHFKKLGLVITDEQHRFGVRQRSLLSNKGLNPDVLVMTATPIPRTLALILYGDLDISIIDELPPGRKKVKTYCIDEKKRKKVYDFVKKEIESGRQVYVVAPLVEESENIDARSALDIYIELKENYLNNYKIGLLHGKMKSYEKDQIMEEFKTGKIQVLVATTVIEVGVNVPNASVMIIENSERFGLAQLHQLRGRVGRGKYQSYCILINYGKSAISKERMKIMEESSNGFVIAEKDLELRGPGEFFGTKQHGLPELKIANLFKHVRILQKVQKEAEILLKEDKNLSLEKNIFLKKRIIDKFGSKIEQLSL